MLNIEKCKDEIKKIMINEEFGLNCASAIVRDHDTNNCHSTSCYECSIKTLDWLTKEYVEPIKLTQFEYDLLVGYTQNDTYHESDRLREYKVLKHLKKQGHFDSVDDLDKTIKEVLENCKVVD